MFDFLNRLLTQLMNIRTSLIQESSPSYREPENEVKTFPENRKIKLAILLFPVFTVIGPIFTGAGLRLEEVPDNVVAELFVIGALYLVIVLVLKSHDRLLDLARFLVTVLLVAMPFNIAVRVGLNYW